jgi:hypothetical protein
VVPGIPVAIDGARLRGLSSASGGVGFGADADLPVVTLMSASGNAPIFVAPTAFHDTGMVVPTPAAATGSALLSVFVAGIPSVPVPVHVTGGQQGDPCTGSLECRSGFCADGVCCNEACTEPCRSCNQAGGAGVCTVLPWGSTDPTASPPCVAPYQCDHEGTCRQGPDAGAGYDGGWYTSYCDGGYCSPLSCAPEGDFSLCDCDCRVSGRAPSRPGRTLLVLTLLVLGARRRRRG